MRALIHDLGQRLRSCAYVTRLVRTRVGDLSAGTLALKVDQCYDIANVTAAIAQHEKGQAVGFEQRIKRAVHEARLHNSARRKPKMKNGNGEVVEQ